MLKQKKVKSKAAKPYSSVAASLSQSKKFEKVGPGEFKLVGEVKADVKTTKGSARKKTPSGK